MHLYTGGCHCGAVRFEATLELQDVMSCNCSICSKTGTLLTFVPANDFKLVKGEEIVKDYQFGKKSIHHMFCPHCGIRTFGQGATPDGAKMYAINARCLDDVDIDALPIKKFDGKSL